MASRLPVTNRVSWSTRLMEGMTIVLSILAAFALDSWWDSRQVSLALDEGLAAVAEELDAARDHVAERVGVYDRVEQYLAAVVPMLAAAGDASTVEVPDTLMAALLYAPTIDPPTGALNAFLESGLLTSVQDHEVRRHLASLPSRYEDGADDELDAADYVLTRIRPALERSLSSSDFDAVLGQMDHYWNRFQPPGSWRSPLAIVHVPGNAEVRNLIASRLQMLQTTRGEVASLGRALSVTDSLVTEARR